SSKWPWGFSVSGLICAASRWALDLKALGLLRRVRVLRTGEHVQLLEHLATQGVLGKHALHRELDHPLRTLVQELLEADALEIAEIAGVVVIELVGHLPAGHADLLGVDHDDMVARVDV